MISGHTKQITILGMVGGLCLVVLSALLPYGSVQKSLETTPRGTSALITYFDESGLRTTADAFRSIRSNSTITLSEPLNGIDVLSCECAGSCTIRGHHILFNNELGHSVRFEGLTFEQLGTECLTFQGGDITFLNCRFVGCVEVADAQVSFEHCGFASGGAFTANNTVVEFNQCQFDGQYVMHEFYRKSRASTFLGGPW